MINLQQAGVINRYRNFPEFEIENYGVAYYGEKNYRTSQAIKKQFDRNKIFSHPQSVVH